MKNVKNLSLIILAILMLSGFSSCDKIKESLSFKIPIKPGPIEIVFENTFPKSSNAEIMLYEGIFDTNLNKILAENGYSINNLQALSFEKAEIKASEPVNFDLSYFIGVKIYFGSPQELVAEASRVSNDKKTLYFNIIQPDLLKYAQHNQIPITIKAPSPVKTELIKLLLELEFLATVKL